MIPSKKHNKQRRRLKIIHLSIGQLSSSTVATLNIYTWFYIQLFSMTLNGTGSNVSPKEGVHMLMKKGG